MILNQIQKPNRSNAVKLKIQRAGRLWRFSGVIIFWGGRLMVIYTL